MGFSTACLPVGEYGYIKSLGTLRQEWADIFEYLSLGAIETEYFFQFFSPPAPRHLDFDGSLNKNDSTLSMQEIDYL